MAASAETQKKSNKTIIIIGVIIILLLAAVIVLLLSRPSLMEIDDMDVPKLGYSIDAKVMTDQASLQAAMNEAMKNAREGRISLKYKNNAYSKDGKTFSCYIANSQSNLYDMFLTIYADAELTDQLFLSGLVPPGSGFDQITLDHALEKGNHTVYVALTQVTENEDGEQVIKNQVVHTIDFHVQ